MNTDNLLRVTEIFCSIQGESTFTGLPTIFIRLTGCPLRCQYCDTAYAFSGGQRMELDTLLARVAVHKVRHVTVTGGEPLAQKNCLLLLNRLCDLGYTVSLETSGALDVSEVDPRVIKILDLKTPGSTEDLKNRYDNLKFLSKEDQIKFVLCDRHDYEWAKEKMEQYNLVDLCHILFSPSYEQLSAKSLAEWILADYLPVRMQIQLHNVIWGADEGAQQNEGVRS